MEAIVTISDEIFQRVENIADELQLSRNEIYAKALEMFLTDYASSKTPQPQNQENSYKSSTQNEPQKTTSQFIPRRLTDYSNESLLTEIRRVASIIPPEKTLSTYEFDNHSLAHSSTLRIRFGSWKKALQLAGCEDRYNNSNQRITEEEIISELRRVANLTGSNILTTRDFEKHGCFERSIVSKHFGSWRKGIEKAGLSSPKIGVRYTDDECFENLLKVWTFHGRAPYHREMNEPPSTVGPKAYINRWGSWCKAIQAFVDVVNLDMQVSDYVPLIERQTEPIGMKKIPISEKREHPLVFDTRS